MNMIRTAIYTRVSTEIQADEGYSLAEQKNRLEAFCVANNYEIYDFYEDAGFSGKDLHRPAMERLIYDAEHKAFNMVIVLKLDRLSRNQRDILYLLEDVFEPNGVEFKSATEPFQTDNLMGKFAISMLAIFAQIERQTIRDRLMLGRTASVKDGYWGGGSVVPLGYNRTAQNTLEINEEEAQIYYRICDLIESGMSLTRTASTIYNEGIRGKKGGKIETINIKRILKNKTYLGLVSYKNEWYQGLHEPLISQERYDRIQARLERICMPDHPSRSTRLLTGILYCPYCGARYGGGTYGKRKKDGTHSKCYICYSRAGTPKMAKSDNCINPAVKCDWLDQYVIDKILSLKFEDMVEKKPKIIDYDKKLQNLRAKYKKLTELYISGTIPIDVLDAKSVELQKAISNLEEEALLQANNLTNKDIIKHSITIARDIFENGTIDQKRALVQSLILRIEFYSKERVDIWWNI